MKLVIEHHETLPSTSDRARQIANLDAPHGSYVVARSQTAGRGRRGRTWHSPPGAGLYVSFVLRPRIALAKTPLITLAVAVALHEAVDGPVGLKWPNDLLATEGRRKVAGILVEASSTGEHLQNVIVGIGINLREYDRPAEIVHYATSLEAIGCPHEEAPLLERLSQALLTRVDGLTEAIVHPWRDAAIGIGERVELIDGAAVIAGAFVGVDPTGAIVLDTDSGRVIQNTGELRLSGAPVPVRSSET